MASIFRWSLRIFFGLALLVVLVLILTYWFAARSLPDYDASLRVQGIDGPVEIVRDNANVPHIFGQSDPDVFFGLGFAHAQDRLWQMMLLRRTAQGRLSEMFGSRTAKTDELLRRLDIYTLSVRSVEHQSPYAQTAHCGPMRPASMRGWTRSIRVRLDAARPSSFCSHPQSRPGNRPIPSRSAS